MTLTPAERLYNLFAGLQRVHGEFHPTGETDEKGKAGGVVKTVRSAPTVELWQMHLDGKRGVGIVPINDRNECVFGAIDVDLYGDVLDHAELARGLKTLNLPLIPCRSKSGGCHIFLFAKVPVVAKAMQTKLREIAAQIGHSTSEIFPKQTTIDPAHSGSWLNMVYFAGDEGARHAVREDGTIMTVAEFLDYAEGLKVDPAFFEPSDRPGSKAATKDPLPKGPPCLNNLVRIGVPEGGRDTFMFNLGIYAKKANPTGWQTDLDNLNNGCCTPRLEPRQMTKIIESVEAKDYYYQCKEPVLAKHCNSRVCRLRKFGVGDNGDSLPEFGLLTNFNTTPARWDWVVDGQHISLSTRQLESFREFKTICLDRLKKVLPSMKQDAWEDHLREAMKSVHVEEIADSGSDEDQFWYLLETFCTGRSQAFEKAEILMGRPFADKDGRTYFCMPHLKEHLHRSHFHSLEGNKIAVTLKQRGGLVKVFNLKGKSTRLWSIPSFPVQTEGYDIPDSIKNNREDF
jgi:hypothetical protein